MSLPGALDETLLASQRVARLATVDARGTPHIMPVCFAYEGNVVYSVIDRKPKRAAPTALKRVRNILANPQVALLWDHYEEEWGRLWYVLLLGTAELLQEGEVHRRAIALLRERYAQYRTMDLTESPVIKVTAHRVISWRATPPQPKEQP